MSGISAYAEVAIPLGVHETFTYTIPAELRDEIRLGSRVEVPFGSKLTTGFVTGLVDTPPESVSRLRNIRSLLDEEEPALIPEILELCQWASTYYLAPLGEMIRMTLPANMASRGRRRVRYAGTESLIADALREKRIIEQDLDLLEEVKGRDLSMQTILADRKSSRGSLARLRDAGLITVIEAFKDGVGVRMDRFVILENALDGLPARQAALIDLLQSRGGEVPHRALQTLGISDSTVGTLVKKGAVRIEKRPRRHTLDAFIAELDGSSTDELRHSLEQRAAIEAVKRRLGTFAPFLLEGVTGSGKTEIYIELMREAVRRGEQAILLVPEISLTPVFASRLKQRFGERIAILHSNLSASERYDQWWKARRGLVDVAIGPRSALFTPFPRLGLIVVDEEGDGAYKQEESPRYNARDLAVVRAQLRNIPVVLGSATPSLESRDNASRGKYELLMLTSRVEERALPEVEIVDIRKERGEKDDRGLVIFGARLREELERVFALGEQAIILMNRRGYAPFLLCRECENDFRCKDCSVTMTVHRRDNLLVCHYCGYRVRIPLRCPLCQGEVLQPIGFGTEKVHERFLKNFPDVPVEVLDRDSTRRKGEMVKILDRFRRGETKALIGTQMISKGHHFPQVTLTGVINADSILGYPDFRSAEKTFYLLTQVAGRSGRGELAGRVMIQTAFPNHYAIRHAVKHDYESFYESEIQFRKTFHYPPVTSMIAILLRGERLENVEAAATQSGDAIEKEAAGVAGFRMQGPAPAPLARIKGVYRYQILLRAPQRTALRELVARSLLGRKWKGVDVSIDVDPINIL